MPTTSTWSIIYPDGTTALTPLQERFQEVATSTDSALSTLKTNIRGTNSTDTIQSLATSISNAAADTGWLNISINSGFAASNSSIPQYRIVGKTVFLRGAFGTTGITTAGTSYGVGQLPTSTAYPTTTLVYVGIGASTANITRITIANTGAITMAVAVTHTSGNGYYIDHTYSII